MDLKNRNDYFLILLLALVLMILASCSSNQDKIEFPSFSETKAFQEPVLMRNATIMGNWPENTTIVTDRMETSGCMSPLNYSNGLLSPRVYSGLLEPQSYLITNFEPLRQDIRNYLQENGINASVYIENLRNGVNVGINQNQGYFPASLNKLPVVILTLQKIEHQEWTFDTVLPIQDSQRSPVSGTLYEMEAKNLTVRELLERTLKQSDNTAFNVLNDNIDKKKLRELLDYYNIKINLDYPYRRLEVANYTDQVTAISMYNLFSSLYLSTVLANPKNSEYILSLLADSDFDVKKIANLPDNVVVAQKYGEYYEDGTKQFHDCGIIYINQSRIFYCIMTNGLDIESAKSTVGFIVNHIYNFVVYERSELDKLRQNSSKD